MSSSISSSDSEFEDTPSDITEYTTIVATDHLPEKSKHLYEKCYQDFIEWREASNVPKTFSENVLLAHFKECSNELKPSTLWTRYSMLRSMLSINHHVNISVYSNLLGFLKKNSKGFKGKKAKTFTPEEIKKFLDEAPPRYLLMKVALIIGVMGACRRYELYELRFDAFTVLQSSIIVTIPNRKMNRARTFTITGKYVNICKEYIKLRPKNCKSPRFLLNYVNDKCTDQHIGINKLGSLGKIIATYLGLPNPSSFTGHCFRRSSASILIDAGGDITAVTRHALRSRVTSLDQNKTLQLQEGLHDSMEQLPMAVHAPLLDNPAVFVRDGKKWLIEYQKGNSNLVVENADTNNVVYMYRCRDSALTVRGNVNGVVLDSCTKCAVVFDNLVSSIEFVNCQSVQMQVIDKVPMVFIDNTDGCQIYLSSQSLDAEIVSSKSSLMNVLVPQGNGDYAHAQVQFALDCFFYFTEQLAESRSKSLRDSYMKVVEEKKGKSKQAELLNSAWSLKSFLRDSASSCPTQENGLSTEPSNVKLECEIDFVDVQGRIKPDTENTRSIPTPCYLSPDTTYSNFPVPKAPIPRLSPGPSPSTSVSASLVASPLQTSQSPLLWPTTPSSGPPSKKSKKDRDAFIDESAASLTSEDHFFMSIAKDSQVLTSFRKIQLRSFVLNKMLELMQEQGVQ